MYRVARATEHPDVESFALALTARLLAEFPRIRLARVEVAERVWVRLEAGGKAQSQAFVPGSGERRVAIVTSNGERAAVTAGIDELVLMRSAGLRSPRRDAAEDAAADSVQPLLVAVLAARWSYGAGEIAFTPYRQGVRSAIVDTFAWHASRSVQHTLTGMADVILDRTPRSSPSRSPCRSGRIVPSISSPPNPTRCSWPTTIPSASSR